MKQLIGSGIRSISDLLRSSSLLFLANVFMNVCNLVFWLFMVRKLDPVDYGTLNSLLSLLMIVGLPMGTFQTVVTKFVSRFHSFDQKEKIKCFFHYFGKRLFVFGFGVFLVFMLFSKNIAHFLQIESTILIVITGFGLFVALFLPITMGTIQGIQRFGAMAVNSVTNGLVRLITGISFVNLGFRAGGALWGFILASISSFVVAFSFIPKKIFKARSCHVSELNLREIYSFFFPVAISMLCYMALINSDVILVKHFFSPLLAGKYSVAQMVGKIILFLPGTVGIVLFPKMSEAVAKNRRVAPFLLKGIILAAVLCISADIVCFSFPSFVMKTLTRKMFVECIPLVRLFCTAMTFYALVQILIFYFLSVHSLRFIPYLVGGVILQTTLITLFHGNLTNVLIALVVTSSIVFIAGLFNVDWKS